MSKLITLDQLKTSLQTTKTYIDQQDAVLSGQIADIVADIEGIVAAGGETNVLEGIKVNGTALTITEKMVDILIAAGEENGTISVNGAAVAVTDLASLAYKSEITEAELSEALKASIAAKATQADLDALEVRVAAVETAIADSSHAHFEVAETVPAVEDAEENVMYLVMNDETGHYDIYAKVGDAVVLLDDTTVDLSNYSTTEAMQAYVAQQITALNVEQFATDEELTAAVGRIAAVETALANVYTKEEADAKFTDEAEAQTIAETAAAAAVAAAAATDEAVNAALDEVFNSEA